MKKIIVALLTLCVMVSCGPKENIYDQFKELDQTTRAQLKELVGDERDAVIEAYIESGYALIMDNVKNESVDSIVMALFYMLSPEQKADMFAAIPAKRLQAEPLQAVYEEYQIELLTSAGNPYIDIVSLKADGTELSLSELVGKTEYVLVDFWASWCGPCRRLMPVLKELYESYHASGKLEILGVSCDRDEAAWLKAVADDELPWLHIRDQRTEPYTPCDKYGISAIPTTILINSDGVIVARNPSEAEIEEWLNK